MSRLVLLSSTLARLSSEGMAPHIKFFGYFASAMAGAGSGDYINEVSDHSNIAWIAGNMSNKVSKAARNGMKSIISMRWELFDQYLNLRSDYRAAWQNIASAVQAAGIEHVAAFYPLDEPYWSASQNCVIDPSHCVTPEQMTTNLATVNALIHTTFPGVPVAVIFAASTLRNDNFVIPDGYDWVGFDCYHGTFDDCGGRSMSWYVERCALSYSRIKGLSLFPKPLCLRKPRRRRRGICWQKMTSIYSSYVRLRSSSESFRFSGTDQKEI